MGETKHSLIHDEEEDYDDYYYITVYIIFILPAGNIVVKYYL
jgi:hypothetical protein